MPWGRVVGAGALAVRYAAGRRVEPSWPASLAPRLAQLGEVDQVSILPLVERLVPDSPTRLGGRLRGEPGVAYLLRTDKATVLFDVGLNLRGQPRPALVDNADLLGRDLGLLDGW